VTRRTVTLLVAASLSALFVGAVPFGGTLLYTELLTPKLLVVAASLFKLAALGAGAVFASRCVRSLGVDGAMRSGWRLMQAWFSCFFVGQLVLTFYEVAGRTAPVPSLGDPLFLLGYIAVTAAAVRFIAGYRSSGFAFGSTRGHILAALGLTALFAGVLASLVGPAARAESPLAARIVNLGYPVLDLVLLVPTLVLLRMTLALRGGRVWGVWGTLLVGVVFFTAGDILFAIPAFGASAFGPLVDLAFLLGYGFAASGAAMQSALLDD